ncbi:MAG: ABC transporter permease [Chloroflexota bacterium]|jgi:lipopolysaccharide transport system permease protein
MSQRADSIIERDEAPPPEYEIRATTGWRFLDLRELWAYRELIYFLTWRDIKVRYKQTAVGIAWAVLQPLAMMIVLSLFFGRILDLGPAGVPYPLFVLSGLVPWQLFARSLTESSSSLVTDQRLITRVYFPRIIVPLSTTLAAIIDLLIALALLAIIMLFYGVVPGWELIWLPLFIFLLLITSLGVGFWLSALNIEYRDVRYVVPFLTQLWFFATPVVYPSSQVPEQLQFIYALNPMVGVIAGFRWSLTGTGDPPSALLLLTGALSLLAFLSGIFWFRRRERTFVDAVGSGGR